MNSFLRNLTTSQQIGALFIVVFGVLSLATLWGFFRSLRDFRTRRRHTCLADVITDEIKHLLLPGR